jgi:hypothetical protein
MDNPPVIPDVKPIDTWMDTKEELMCPFFTLEFESYLCHNLFDFYYKDNKLFSIFQIFVVRIIWTGVRIIIISFLRHRTMIIVPTVFTFFSHN